MVECRLISTQGVRVSLNIKNEETHRRVRELAGLAGETMTQAVDRAVVERLDRLTRARNRARRADKLLQIGRECAALPVLDERSPEDMLYDERGLPR
jgi:antitoxin VapB